MCQGGACVCDPASQACGGVVFAISPNQPNGSNVVNWPGSAWTVSGTIHSNSDVAISGTGNVINGVIEHVTGFTISPDNTLNPSTNNPVKSTVLPDPVNKTPADFYQGTASTATYHYINGNTSLSSYVTNGVLQSGIYYVNGNIDFFTTMSQTVTSNVTLVATGSIYVHSATLNIRPYYSGMAFFANATISGNGLTITPSGGSWRGIVYAPHSYITYSGSANTTGAGSLVGNRVTINGSAGHLTYDSSLFPPP